MTDFPQKLKDAVRNSHNVFVFSGAGASKESGLPTFREADGLWKKYDPMTLASMEGFNADPVLVWNMYKLRQKQIAEARPNAGHIALAEMEPYYNSFLIVTQNVDNLHERGGSKNVVHIHGSADEMRCLGCGSVVKYADFNMPEGDFTKETLPRCPKCGSLYRPNIVWFGEYLPEKAITTAVMGAKTCDLMFIVGTSGEVSGGYGFTEYALEAGAFVVDVNPTKSHLTDEAHCHVAMPSGEALPMIRAMLDK